MHHLRTQPLKTCAALAITTVETSHFFAYPPRFVVRRQKTPVSPNRHPSPTPLLVPARLCTSLPPPNYV